MTDLAPAPAAAPKPATAGRPTWSTHLEHLLRTTWAALVAGLVAGLVFGGVGGRIAMRIVTLQSDPRFDGVLTDDGARVNEITVEGTAVLVMFTTFVGVVGALGYLVVRSALGPSTRGRAAVFAAVCGVVGGSQVVDADGVDFTLLGQRWVSVALFVGLLVGYGATTAVLVERLLAADAVAWRVRRPVLALPFLALAPVLAFIPVGVAVLALATARHRGATRLVPRAALVWATRLALLGGTALAGAMLASTLVELA